MTDHRFILEPYNGMKSRYRCPQCNKNNVFTRYIDTQTNEHLNDAVGMCSRLNKCAYHYPPKQYFQDNDSIIKVMPKYKPVKKAIIIPKPSFIKDEVMRDSLESKSPNYFIDLLAKVWSYEVAFYLSQQYNIGTSDHWEGATVFWQVDTKAKVRSGKIMLYNAFNGKRVKQPYNHINWVHNTLNQDDFNLQQCYFGLHLINKDLSKPVAIVESEKTAIISSIYLPEFIWIACGSANNLNEAKTRILKGRNVVLFPDLGCYDLWNNKIPSLTKLASFRTSSLLEDKATEEERAKGYDIADYLLRINN